MLKRNLFAIAIIILGLGITSSVFGQESARIRKPKNQINSSVGFMDYTDDACTICDGKYRTATINSPRDSASGQATGKTLESTNKIQLPQPKGMNKPDLTEQLSIKSPRDVASGQATGKVARSKTKNLGDTATHEVGHKQKRH